MAKIAILGVENSHVYAFLEAFYGENPEGVEIVGIYSEEKEAVDKILEKYDVPVMENYDSLAGQLDAVVIVARHGDNHYKYAKPYIPYGIPMFIDKPITCSEEEAVEFMRELKAHDVRICGGSICPHAPEVEKMAEIVRSTEVFSGNLYCPISLNSVYGGFHFYCQHLSEIMLSVFGYDLQAVNATRRDNTLTFIARYPKFDVTATYSEHYHKYHITVAECNDVHSELLTLDGVSSPRELWNLLQGNPSPKDYDTFIFPVFVHNAILRSVEKNGWEEIKPVKV